MTDNVDVITKTSNNVDLINNPQHYACEAVTVSYTVEPIELCEMCGFLLGNALKYLFRYQHKGKPLEDLMKAQYYLRRYKKRGDHVNSIGWYQDNKIALAFKDKDFFKYCDVAEGSLFIDDGLLQFVDEKIAEYQMKSVEMGK